MPQISRRHVIKAAATSGVIGLAGCQGGGDGSDGNDGGATGTPGGSAGTASDGGDSSDTKKVGVTQHSVGGSWITAFFDAGKVYAQSQGYQFESFLHNEDAQEQITQIRQMVNQDYDGIVAVPWDESVNTAIEEAEAENIPVFSANNTIESEHIKTFTAFGNYNAGKRCGEAMLEALENQKGAMDTWDILNVRGDFFFQSNQRTDGFVEAVEAHDKTNIVDTIQTDWSQTDAQQKTLEWLNAHEAPDGVYSSNMTSGLGVLSALERQDLVVPKGNEGHIVHTQLDGGPDVNPRVGEGTIDLAVDQPNYYYIPLAMKQMEDWWENGDDALPEPGTELTAEDYPFEPATYMQGATETQLFTEPIWAPAQVQEANGHINVQTAGITITEENYDAPYHWGNIWG